MENKEGQQIPEVTFRTRKGNDWVDVSSKELFEGKNVVLFALPGAYTPTCSSTHLPRYNELAPVFKKEGVDSIICLSVNDAFVMNEWAKDQHAENVMLIPDGNGEFSEKMGLLVDKSDLGFGKRSWRYSMHVKDGVIQKMFLEPEKPGDPFEVSDADTMLEYIAPGSQKPRRVSMITKKGCPFCQKAKDLLEDQGMDYEEIQLNDKITHKTLSAISGKSTTPQVFIDGELIGGSDDLEKYLNSHP
jgi:glutaredoxin-like protein